MSDIVGFTSISANPKTAESLAKLRRLGSQPVVITEEANRSRLREVLSVEDYRSAIVLQSLFNPVSAAQELSVHVRKRRLHLRDWINITDATSVFYLHGCRQLRLKAPFLTAYENCRLKPLSRRLANAAGVCDTNFRLHNVGSTALPGGFTWPFIAKPIMGTGSEGVSLIDGRGRWTTYLSAASGPGEPESVRLRGMRPDKQVLVEEILAGQECQIDGFISAGEVEVCAIGVKWCDYTVMGYRERRGVVYRPFSLPDAVSRDRLLIGWVTRLLSCLKFRSGTFHIEAKVNGPKIRLLEINPRPGGGANVEAVRMLSGIDLNEVCLALWLGLPALRRERPITSSLAFAVRYPQRLGSIAYVHPAGRLDISTKAGTPLDWQPLVREGTLIDPAGAEQYLGVLLAPGACRLLEDADVTTSELLDYVGGPTLIREKTE